MTEGCSGTESCDGLRADGLERPGSRSDGYLRARCADRWLASVADELEPTLG